MSVADFNTSEIISLTRRQLAERAIVLDGKPFSLYDYPFYHEIYNNTPDKLLLICGRQVAKTTTSDNVILTDAMARPYFKQLYIAPTQKQAQIFSSQRMTKAINYSPVILDNFTSTKIASGVWHRAFTNGSDINVSYAYDDPDRVRGQSADRAIFDEIQDIVYDAVVPVIVECTSNSDYGYEMYAGTPKTMDNPAQILWSKSTRHEWMMRCHGCNKVNYVTSEKSLGKTGLICVKCGHSLNSREGFWYPTGDPNAQLKGYHIPQPILPRNAEVKERWEKLLYKVFAGIYSDTRIKNEVFGVSDAVGSRLVSRTDMEALCKYYYIYETPLDQIFDDIDTVTAGADWGGDGKVSGTSLTALYIHGNVRSTGKRRLLFFKTWLPGTHYITILDEIVALMARYRVQMIVGDAGGGAVANAYLVDKLGGRKVLQSQYVSSKTPVVWNKVNRINVDRTAAIDSMMMQFLNGTIELPKKEMSEPFIQHVMALHETTTDTSAAGGGRRVWQRNPASPDDLLHASIYAGLAMDVIERKITYYPTDSPGN